MTGVIAVGRSLALGKFLILHYNIRCIDGLSIPVRILSCLDPSGDNNLCPLVQILLSEFAILSKSNTSDEIC